MFPQFNEIRNDLANLPPMTAAADVHDVFERYLFLDRVGVAARDGIEQMEQLTWDDRDTSKSSGQFRTPPDHWQSAEFDWDVVLRIPTARRR